MDFYHLIEILLLSACRTIMLYTDFTKVYTKVYTCIAHSHKMFFPTQPVPLNQKVAARKLSRSIQNAYKVENESASEMMNSLIRLDPL